MWEAERLVRRAWFYIFSKTWKKQNTSLIKHKTLNFLYYRILVLLKKYVLKCYGVLPVTPVGRNRGQNDEQTWPYDYMKCQRKTWKKNILNLQ